ncbi:hypothetical protein DUI87_28338 [Hirundo rustica rustica]|uniref:Uncharacterized protein n=1 Tax=Hirundo rustica rustica TaxID=333673 RepID=A0A3M0J1N5_HIRRU|nr:hypothetical protein DUI87_28338 [Hirundo rustica rustica]
MASSRNIARDCPAWNLDEINFSVLWDLARIFELVEHVDNGTYKRQFSLIREEKEVSACEGNNMGAPSLVEKKEGGEELQALEAKFLYKP